MELLKDDTTGVQFTNSCMPVDLPCEVGTHFINPCNCSSYYQCHQRYKPPLLRYCGPGTAWDRTLQNCNDKNTIHLRGICSRTQPWTQCSKIYDNLTQNTINDLRRRCVSIDEPHGEDNGQGGLDAGAIIGGVIGGLIAVILLMLVILYLRSKGGFLREIPKSLRFRRSDVKTSANNPQYSADDEYSTIDEAMDNSDYHTYDKTDSIKPPVPKRPLKTLSIPDIIQSSNSTDESGYDNGNELKFIPAIPFRIHQVPSGYSSPYQLEMATNGTNDHAQLSSKTLEIAINRTRDRYSDERAPHPLPRTNRSVPTRLIPEYVDFGDMDRDYSVATTHSRYDIRNIENKW